MVSFDLKTPRAPRWSALLAILLWTAVALYAASAVILVVPENPATLPLRPYKRAVSPLLGQDWRLFAPDLNNVESETIVTARFADGTESDTISLSRKFRDLSVRGIRRFLPSRLIRVLEAAEIELNNAHLVAQRVSRFVDRAREGEELAIAITQDPRLEALAAASKVQLAQAMRTYQAVVARFAEFVFAGRVVEAFRARLTVVYVEPHRKITEFEPNDQVSFLDDLEREIAQDVVGGRGTLVDTGWFRVSER